jgi:hypothetical protein
VLPVAAAVFLEAAGVAATAFLVVAGVAAAAAVVTATGVAAAAAASLAAVGGGTFSFSWDHSTGDVPHKQCGVRYVNRLLGTQYQFLQSLGFIFCPQKFWYRLVWAKKVSLAVICHVAGSASFGIRIN